MMEAACTSETSVENYFTRQYILEDNSEHLPTPFCYNCFLPAVVTIMDVSRCVDDKEHINIFLCANEL
jgi:hypothetical protein